MMAPYSEIQSIAPCEYFENILSTETGILYFIWRVAHCKKPVLSAIEILDMNGFVVATTHSISNLTIPLKRQVDQPLNVQTHSSKTERSFLIRGLSGDFAILKAMWKSFAKEERNVREQIGQLKLKLFRLDKYNSQRINIFSNPKNSLHYQWELDECKAYVDLEKSSIRLSKLTKHVPENICIATAITMAFVLCQPRSPPSKDSYNVIAAYPSVSTESGRVLNFDSMLFLVASGLYSSFLPRWYHATCYRGYFYQIHPNVYKKKRDRQNHFDSFEVEFDSCELETDVVVADWDGVNDKGRSCAVDFGGYKGSGGSSSVDNGDHSGTEVASGGKGSSSISDKTRLKENSEEVGGNGDKSGNKGGLQVSGDCIRSGERSNDSGGSRGDEKLSGAGDSGKDGKNSSGTSGYIGSKVTLGVYVNSSVGDGGLSNSDANGRGGGGLSSTSRYREDENYSSGSGGYSGRRSSLSGGGGGSSSYGGGGSSSYGGGGNSSYGGGGSSTYGGGGSSTYGGGGSSSYSGGGSSSYGGGGSYSYSGGESSSYGGGGSSSYGGGSSGGGGYGGDDY